MAVFNHCPDGREWIATHPDTYEVIDRADVLKDLVSMTNLLDFRPIYSRVCKGSVLVRLSDLERK